jgi:hypothetical protein
VRGGVFVCHASKDAGVAQRIVAALEAGGVPCWIAPRDIEPGENYAQAILEGLEAAPAVVLVFSAATNESPHVTRELETAISSGRPIVPVRLEDVQPSASLRYFIGTSHWLDTVGSSTDLWEAPLVRAVRRTVEQRGQVTQPATRPPPPRSVIEAPVAPPASEARARSGSGRLVLAALLALAVLGAVATAVLVLRDDDATDDSSQPSAPASGAAKSAEPSEADASTAEQQEGCPVPVGRRGLAAVFPSLTSDCESVVPKIPEKAEVFECPHQDYLLRFTRWEQSYDWLAYYDAENGVPGTEWDVDGEVSGRQWLSFENSPDETDPWQWSAAYERFPFSLSIESATEDGRREGILEVQVVSASKVGLR